ncbi:hypothetical protein H5397_07755 [Propioniciclava sp. MC1683]|uniref:hypothetical protein n=1 Tax=Propioniciclava sp. MC1683 TaxID=2760309 RepID=UPI0015FFB590|nr:hypothetical protein [Propioniciclava sp. MC1683]MBB1501321.1 hypothetical protein [Propioniciclava sp. MC1683]
MTPADQPEEARSEGLGRRSGLLIAVAFFTASALGFVLLGVVSRWVTPEQTAQFLALWGLVFGIGSALSAVEQEIVRLATNAHLDRVRVPGRALQVTGLAIAVAVVVVLVIALLPGVGELLRQSVLVAALVFVATGGFAVQCMSRAVLLGTNQVTAYVSVIVLEALLRLVLAAGFVLGGVAPTLGLAALVIVIGCFGWVPVVGRVLRQLGTDTSGSSLRSVGSAVGALGLANGLQSVQVTAFPAVASAILGISAAMAPVYGAVTLARLPLVALAPVQAMAVPVATRLIRSGRMGDLLGLVAKLSAGGFACAALALGGGWLLGPWALRLYMGPGYDIAPAVIALLLAASCVLAVALLIVAALIALERYWTAVTVWLVAGIAVVLTLAAAPLAPDMRAAAGVVVGALVSWAAASVAVTREARRRA